MESPVQVVFTAIQKSYFQAGACEVWAEFKVFGGKRGEVYRVTAYLTNKSSCAPIPVYSTEAVADNGATTHSFTTKLYLGEVIPKNLSEFHFVAVAETVYVAPAPEKASEASP